MWGCSVCSVWGVVCGVVCGGVVCGAACVTTIQIRSCHSLIST